MNPSSWIPISAHLRLLHGGGSLAVKVGVKGKRTEAAPSHSLFLTFHSLPSLKFRCWTSLASSEGRGRRGAVNECLEKEVRQAKV